MQNLYLGVVPELSQRLKMPAVLSYTVRNVLIKKGEITCSCSLPCVRHIVPNGYDGLVVTVKVGCTRPVRSCPHPLFCFPLIGTLL